MATASAIIVKKADGTTDVTWTVLTGSAGDRIPAVYRSETSASGRANRATFTIMAQSNGPKTARRVTSKVVFPAVRTVNGAEQVVGQAIFELTALIPDTFNDNEMYEATAQAINLLSSSTNRNAIQLGYAPT